MGSKRERETSRTLASMRRRGVAPTYSDTHDVNGHKLREPRPAPRRQGTRAAVVAYAVREG